MQFVTVHVAAWFLWWLVAIYRNNILFYSQYCEHWEKFKGIFRTLNLTVHHCPNAQKESGGMVVGVACVAFSYHCVTIKYLRIYGTNHWHVREVPSRGQNRHQNRTLGEKCRKNEHPITPMSSAVVREKAGVRTVLQNATSAWRKDNFNFV